MGVPAIGSDIYGVRDAISDDETGILVQPKNPDDLFRAMESLVDDQARLTILGEAARTRVKQKFSRERVVSAILDDYRKRLT